MYECSSTWKEYNETADPVWRKETLAEFAKRTDLPAAEVQIRQKLWDARFAKPLGKSYADGYIGFMLEMIMPRAVWETAGRVKESLLAEANRLGYADAVAAGEDGLGAFYWEWRSAAARYLATCQSDSYGRKLFGLMKLTDEERELRMEKDLHAMTTDVIKKYNLDSEEPLAGFMKLYAKALWDAAANRPKPSGSEW